jgi:hypothetical protein
MNLGGGGAFSAALAAPVLTAPPLDSGDPNAPSAAAGNKKIFMMFGALAMLLIVGMVVMFFMLQPKAPAPVAGTTPEGSGTAAAPGSPASPGTAAPTAPAASTAAAPAPAGGDTTAAGGTPGTVADNSPKASAPSVGVKHPSGGGGGGSPAPVDHSAPVAVVAPPPPPANNSLDSLMAGAVGGNKAPANPAPAAGATEPFDRGAASASLGSIADSVASCKKPGGPTGDGHVSITFAPSGHVLSAVVDQPPYAGTAVGGCVAGKFRSAHVPPFAGGNMPVGKRFSIN